jgi:chemotaxis protein CheD
MIKSRDRRSGSTLYILYSGDYYATRENCVLGTVTGSCVVVCLYDPLRGTGGMGHLIIPGAMGTEGIYRDKIAVHGVTQMEHIIGEMIKLGGDRRFLKAKIFGASYNNDPYSRATGLSFEVIKFIHEYFSGEGIPVVSDDLGGDHRRKIYFYPSSGRVFRKFLVNNEEHSEFIRMEKEYIDGVFNNRERYGKVILFE